MVSNAAQYMADNARCLVPEFGWLCAVAEWRAQANDGQQLPAPKPPEIAEHTGIFADFVQYYKLGLPERLVLILALAPHVHPAAMNFFLKLQEQHVHATMQLSKQANGTVWPVGFTALWLLAGNNLEAQFGALPLFETEHFFSTHHILKLQGGTDARLQGQLQLNDEYVDLFTSGNLRKPDFNSQFPAKLLKSPLNWADLVLPANTLQQIDDIKIWLQHHPKLMGEWQMDRVLKPGYKAMFYGPPGTGKTLTAVLLGKSAGLDVYRIDLSTVVSKYIGETEKNLELVFKKAENKNWILFFDEADALFGKRTGISDAHDKYANQEVSYLLQRLEEYNGLVILCSNLRSNIDDGFARRLQSIVYFPLPEAAHRYKLWQNAFSPMTKMEEGLNLEWIADKYDLAGGSIINVVQYASLQSLHRNENIIRRKDVLEGIRREYNKDGRTL
ncbi:MAG: ATP-binding protein [Bacteroidetes bacterium]|nr:MAG: ATP-binding protein [Bacteroidota bacterium]